MEAAGSSNGCGFLADGSRASFLSRECWRGFELELAFQCERQIASLRQGKPCDRASNLLTKTDMASIPSLELRAPRREEHEALFSWLNDGLRSGGWRRLEREFPNVAETGELSQHVLALSGGNFAAHALAHTARVRAGVHQISLGMIGMVYTAPERRRNGLAKRCIEAAVDRVRAEGVGLCLLWSELEDFYKPLGFVRAGREWFFWLGRDELCSASVGNAKALHVSTPRADDWPAMEALYSAHVAGALRPTGSLQRLASGPDCAVRVARREQRLVAYAARGRGDDFPDIVHEWAGESASVLACLGDLVEGRDWLGFLCPPSAPAMLGALSALGARRFPNDLAWFRVVDAAVLWSQLCENAPALRALEISGDRHQIACASAGGNIQLDADAFLAWILRGQRPAALDALLSPPQRRLIEAALPVPLYLWGFDSV